MIQMEKKITTKMIETVEIKMLKFHGGPSSFQMSIKKTS